MCPSTTVLHHSVGGHRSSSSHFKVSPFSPRFSSPSVQKRNKHITQTYFKKTWKKGSLIAWHLPVLKSGHWCSSLPCFSGSPGHPLCIWHSRTGWPIVTPSPGSRQPEGQKKITTRNKPTICIRLEWNQILAEHRADQPFNAEWEDGAEHKHDPEDGAHDESQPEDLRLGTRVQAFWLWRNANKISLHTNPSKSIKINK